jgi:hypothetical protein
MLLLIVLKPTSTRRPEPNRRFAGTAISRHDRPRRRGLEWDSGLCNSHVMFKKLNALFNSLNGIASRFAGRNTGDGGAGNVAIADVSELVDRALSNRVVRRQIGSRGKKPKRATWGHAESGRGRVAPHFIANQFRLRHAKVRQPFSLR